MNMLQKALSAAALTAAISSSAWASGTVCPDGTWSPTGVCVGVPNFDPCGPRDVVQFEECCPIDAYCIDGRPTCPIKPFHIPLAVGDALEEHGLSVPHIATGEWPSEQLPDAILIMKACLETGYCQENLAPSDAAAWPECRIVCDNGDDHVGPNCRIECKWYF